ncbi:hypothetical protein Tdes44962_MAKER02806 [Teratosphaeria destructans]|uniref:Indole-diterpene biosynthesis protein PaxU n=1 Tax=Teratosphaeria destructans TaxID=418781 RepID=A0A9W7SSI3_9PEZI|nr:hypothetical protein Tdes44962_MAKER02806 [Teratosphaeria destructans]
MNSIPIRFCRSNTSMDIDTEKILPQLSYDLHRRTSPRSSPSSSPRSWTPDHAERLSPSTSPAPQTVILGLWPYASSEQIAYYVQGYEALYPSARLLLLRYSSSYDERIGNALDALTSLDETKPSQTSPNVLLHLFSGCGAAQGCRLLRAYKIRTGHQLPVKALVMDSVPKLPTLSLRASTRSPTTLLAFFAMLVTVFYVRLLATFNYWQFDRRCQQNRRDLNDPNLLPADARKCYIFSERDLMFSWHDSPSDSDECERDDIRVRRKSVDEKGRWTGDQERYWQGIENFWDER